MKSRSRIFGALILALGSTFAARADYQSTVLSQSPRGYWRLNETTAPPTPPIFATNAGSLGAAGNGEYAGGVIRGQTPGGTVSEPANGAARFLATAGNRVRVPYAPQWNQTGPYSVEFWAKPAQTAAFQGCAAASVEFIAGPPAVRNGWLLYQGNAALTTGNGWQLRQYNSTGPAVFSGAGVDMALNTTLWYHIVATFDGTTFRLYTNGAQAASGALAGTPRANTNVSLAFGARSDGLQGFFEWSGDMDECAMYTTALSAAQVLTHYQAGTNASPATPYQAVVTADSPAGYWRLNEPADPAAANLGSAGAAANAKYFYNAMPAQVGPRPPAYAGLEAGNNAVSLDGASGSVQVPALNLNTNTVTITCWVKPTGSQPGLAPLVLQRARTAAGGAYSSTGGLVIDQAGGLQLSYNWDGETFGAFLSGVNLVDSDWNFASLTIQPDKAIIYVPGQTPATNFNVHAALRFEGITYFGVDPFTDVTTTTRRLTGSLDEVAIFNRALSLGEIYSQYAAAAGTNPPVIFGHPQAPAGTLYAGDPLQLTVDAGGTPALSYQWRKTGFGPIGGATSSAYTVASASAGDSGTYDVEISNSFGTNTSTAAVVVVTPQVTPTFTQNIVVPSRTLFAGGAIKLAVATTGGGVGYQWKKNGTDISGQTGASLTINAIVSTNAGTYTVVASNSISTATSASAAITVAAPAAGSYDAFVAADGPISWYRLDDGVGSPYMLDAMGRWDGIWTNQGSPVTLGVNGALAGNANKAAHFDLANKSYGEVPTLPPPITTGDITVECWVRVTNTTDNLSSVSIFRNQYGNFFRKTDGGINWRACGGYGDLDGTVNFRNSPANTVGSGQWTHVAAFYSPASGHRVFINGVWDGNPAPNVSYLDSSRALNIPLRVGVCGPFPGETGYFFDGEIDEVAVYNKVLTDAQILSHYQSALFGSGVAPFFVAPLPASQTVVSNAAANVTFSGAAQGTYPIAYQWFFNGSPISAATTTTLTRSATYSNAGVYMLRATNSAGSTNISASLTVMPASPAFVNVTNDLVLHLKFDGDYTDSSGHGHNATPVGDPSIVTGRIGSGGVHYYSDTANATNSYLSLGNPADLRFSSNVNFSVSYWVKLPYVADAPQTNGDLPFLSSALNSYGNPGYTFAPSFKLGGWSYSLNGISQVYGGNNSINNSNWHHLVHTFNRTGSGITYLNGLQVDSRQITGAGDLDTGNVVNIGNDPSGAYPEDGIHELDDVAVWRRALSAYEAYAIYHAATNSSSSFDVPGSVTLQVAKSGTNVVISWRPGSSLGTLQQADNPAGPWSNVSGVYAPSYTVAPTAFQKYYRLQLN